jgi:predicted O-methyltransferase YrrM
MADTTPKATWAAVDGYVTKTVVRPDAALDEALRSSASAGLPSIAVSAPQGKLLHLLAKMTGAKRVLEIGTLGGYSTIWLARALPSDGRLTSLELDPKHADVARNNLARAGVGDHVEILVGPALETLPKLTGPFDFVFVDADKVSIPQYFEHSLRLTRPGATIVLDNVVRDGKLADSSSADASVQGVRKLHEMIATGSRVDATTIQTVGAKGYDGFTLVRVE